MRYLIGYFAFAAESRVSLAVVDARLHNPLQIIERLEGRRLVEQFVDELLGAVGLHL